MRSLQICPLAPSVRNAASINKDVLSKKGSHLRARTTIRLPIESLPGASHYEVNQGEVTIHRRLSKRCPEELVYSPTPEFHPIKYLFYRMREGEQVGKILKFLRIKPLWGPKGTVQKTFALNKSVMKRKGDRVRTGTAINLPVSSLPPSPLYYVTDAGEVIIGGNQEAEPPQVAQAPPTKDNLSFPRLEELAALPKDEPNLTTLTTPEINTESVAAPEAQKKAEIAVAIPDDLLPTEEEDLELTILEAELDNVRPPGEMPPPDPARAIAGLDEVAELRIILTELESELSEARKREPPYYKWLAFHLNFLTMAPTSHTTFQVGWSPYYRFAKDYAVGMSSSVSLIKNPNSSLMVELLVQGQRHFEGAWYAEINAGIQSWSGNGGIYPTLGLSFGLDDESEFFPSFLNDFAVRRFFIGYNFLVNQNAHIFKIGTAFTF